MVAEKDTAALVRQPTGRSRADAVGAKYTLLGAMATLDLNKGQ